MARTDPSQLMQLAQSLARQVPAQAQMPDYGADIGSINRDYALADALAQQQYIPDSGWLGALAQIASAGAGAWKASKADKRAAELTKRMNTDAQGAQQAEAERQAAARAQQIQQIAEAYKIDPQQAAVVADGLGKAADFKAPEAEKPKLFNVKGQLVSVGPDGKPQVVYSAPRDVAAKAQPPTFGADLDRLVSAGIVSPDEAKKIVREKQGLDRPANSGAKPLSAKDAVAAQNRAAAGESLLSSIGNAERMLSEGEVSTGPIAGRLTAGWTEGAQKYQAEIGGILAELRRLQKTPGSGADSDRELDILIKQVPNMTTDEDAALAILKRLREKAQTYGMGRQAQIIPGSSQAQQSDDGWGMEEIR